VSAAAAIAEDANPVVLELDNITGGYQGNEVLQDVNLELRKSSVVALLGPNGAGKTTLLRYASGLIGGRAGHLKVGGQDVTGQPSYALARRGVCHIPEGRAIYPSLTVRENIALLSPREVPARLTEIAVAAFPVLGKRLGQTAGTLSGGEQQMLALSRAYIGDPVAVLLDEVSMGLAPLVVSEIFSSIEELKRRQVSLLLVEQYVDRALEIADYVYVLNHGRICAQGPASTFNRATILASYLGEGP
jgi:branched-chain amino acid transport system ATP-binding protein